MTATHEATSAPARRGDVPAVDLRGVTKHFGPVRAVRGIDLRIGQGEIVAFLGPNGAGKTSTIDVVLGLSEPTTGTVEVLGMRPHEATSRGLVAAVLQTGGLLKDLTVAETVAYTASLRAELADLERLGRDALADVRRAVEGYRELTLPGEIARAKAALDAADIEADVPGSTDEVPSEVRELFAWTVREGVTNVIRHSGARRCVVRVAADRVEVHDDGRGPGGGSRGGHGLRGLEERAREAGAMLVTRSLEPHGFALELRVA